jgi:hypothetical protein
MRAQRGKSSMPNRGALLAKHAQAERLSRAATRSMTIDFVPHAMTAGDRRSLGHVFHASVFLGHYELLLDGRGVQGANVIAIDDRHGDPAELLAAKLRRCAAFYARLAKRIEALH